MDNVYSHLMQEHLKYMNRCLELARMGRNRVAPNPMVGAIIVYNNQIIGEGYHREFGKPHAEVNAINSVSDLSMLSESTMYVNLEPCSHYGKTPPCSDLIVQKKIKKVVIGCLDSNPDVAGKGVAHMQNNGVNVEVGVLEKESRKLNRRFFTFHEKRRPYIILKWAQSADGYMDINRKDEKPEIHWISTVQSKRLVHTWRAMEPAILIGNKTAINDDPELTTREVYGANMLRILIDPTLKTKPTLKIYNKSANTLVVNHIKEGIEDNIEYLKLDNSSDFLQALFDELYQRNILTVMVEGGKKTHQHFIESGLWDEARIINGKVFFKDGLKAPEIHRIPDTQYQIGSDRVDTYYNIGGGQIK
jgi:diaminohydroxyphosphoribosylaminopyrimidine deaminase/5-amino-6-(5-phosphoribosylamino)uracil reductase